MTSASPSIDANTSLSRQRRLAMPASRAFAAAKRNASGLMSASTSCARLFAAFTATSPPTPDPQPMSTTRRTGLRMRGQRLLDESREPVAIRTEEHTLRRLGRKRRMRVEIVAERGETDVAAAQRFALADRIEQSGALHRVAHARIDVVDRERAVPAENIAQHIAAQRIVGDHATMRFRRDRGERVVAIAQMLADDDDGIAQFVLRERLRCIRSAVHARSTQFSFSVRHFAPPPALMNSLRSTVRTSWPVPLRSLRKLGTGAMHHDRIAEIDHVAGEIERVFARNRNAESRRNEIADRLAAFRRERVGIKHDVTRARADRNRYRGDRNVRPAIRAGSPACRASRSAVRPP